MKCLLLFLLLVIAYPLSAQLDLVSRWEMDSNCQLIDISDESSANGVLVDVSLTSDRNNVSQSALSFNQSTSYVTFGSVEKLKLADDKTISFWVRPIPTGSNHTGSIINFGSGINIRYQEVGSLLQLVIIFGGTTYLTENLTANQWQSVAITFTKNFNSTKSKVVYFLDGGKISELEQNKSSHDFANSIVLLGAQNQNTLTNGFRGALDDLRIFDRVLTDAEIQNLALPVTLEFFRAKKANSGIELSWKTQIEENVSHFELQKSLDGISFEGIARVEAGKYNYVAYDVQGSSGVMWYRLKVVDRDGKITYSNVVKISQDANDTAIKLFPNPSSGKIQIVGASGYGRVTIINTAGITVRQKQLTSNNIVDVSDLIPGLYYIIFNDGNKRMTTKFHKR
jgi:hypothetical protein